MARNTSGTLFASAARALAQAYSSSTITNVFHRGVRVFIETTAVTSSPSVVPTIQVYDPVGDVWHTVLTGAAITGTGVVSLIVYPGCIAVTNLVVNQPLARKWKLVMTHGNTDSITYSASFDHLV